MKKTLIVLMMVMMAAMLIVSCDNKTAGVHKVTFTVTGGTGSYDDQEVADGGKATKSETDPTPSDTVHYVFDCWTLEGGDDAYDFNEKVTEDINLVAKWKYKYAKGDTGPAGGTIITVCTDDTLDWKFIELAPTSAGSGDIGDFESGQYTYTGWDKEQENTTLLKSYLRTNCVTSTVIALADDYKTTGSDGKVYTDWYLPTKDQIKDAAGYLTTACWTSSTIISYGGSSGTMDGQFWVYCTDGTLDRNSGRNYAIYCIRRF